MNKATQDQIAHIMLTRGAPEQQQEAMDYFTKGTLVSDLANATMTLEKKQIELAQIIRELMDRLCPVDLAPARRFVHGDPLAVRALNAIQGISKP